MALPPAAAGNALVARWVMARQPGPTGADAVSQTAAAVKIRDEAVPALQRAVDALDSGAVVEVGKRLAVDWARLAGPGGGGAPASDEYTRARDAVLGVLGPQTAFGVSLRPGRTVPPLEGDLTPVLVRQVEEMGQLVRDAAEMVGILERHRAASSSPSESDQARIVELWRTHPNPWHTAFMQELVRTRDLVGWLSSGLTDDQNAQILTLLESAEWLAGEGRLRPTDPVGAVEARLQERAVRVLTPQTPRELAVLLYDDEALGLRMLKAYNQNQLAAIAPDALVPSGVLLAVDPRQLGAALGLRFRAAEIMRDKVDRPVLDAQPDGPAVTGTTSRYTVRWPAPETPEAVADAPDAVRLPWRGPLKKHISRVRIDMAAEHDPVAVGEGKVPDVVRFAAADIEPGEAEKGVSVEKSWPVSGRHFVLALIAVEPRDAVDRDWIEANIPSGMVTIRLPQPVTSSKEAADVEMERTTGPRDGPPSFAKTAWMRERMGLPASPDAETPNLAGLNVPLILDPKEIAVAEALGASGPQHLAGDPRELLGRLERHRAALPEEEREKMDDQIDALKKAIAEKGAEDLRRLDGVFVSTKGPGVVVPLSLFARTRPGGAGQAAIELIDFTLQGKPRSYKALAKTSGEALKEALEDFADDAPYPEGIVRFAIGPWHIAGGDPTMQAETVEHETDGGVLLDDYLQMAGFGFLLLAIAAAIIPGAQGLVVPMLVLSGLTAAAGSVVNLYDRLEHGDFEWDLSAGLDVLNIAAALLTLGTLSAATSAVKGVGQVAMVTRIAQGVNFAQLGLVVGVHSKEIAAAIRTGSAQAVVNALLRAAMDGALVLVVHKAVGVATRGAGEPGATGGPAPGRAAGDEAGGRPQTARGTITPGAPNPGGPGRPTGPRSARERHEEWVATRLRPELGPREAQPASGLPQKPGEVQKGIADPDQALALFDDVVARTPDREVGLYWNAKDGTYMVKVGAGTSIGSPGGAYETVMHTHPNPENVLTVRMPAPNDVQLSYEQAVRTGRQIDEAIDFALPDGRRGRTQYTVDPRGTVTIRIDGRAPRRYANPAEYQSSYSERTTHAARKSETYEDMWRDLNEMYGDKTVLPPDEPGQTATGSIKPGRPSPGPEGSGAPRAGTKDAGPAPAPDPTGASTKTVATGGVRRGDGSPLSNAEVQELLNKAVGDGPAPTPMQVWRAVDATSFAQEWGAAGGDPARLPGAFTDGHGVVWVNAADESSLLVFHEAVHQRAILNGSAEPFRERFGSFLEEGITEGLAREVLGPHGHRHAYDAHVRFLPLMRQHLGVSEPMVRAAYLRGQTGPMEAHIRAGVGGDPAAHGWLLATLRNIGTYGENRQALIDAIYVMVHKRPPPTP